MLAYTFVFYFCSDFVEQVYWNTMSPDPGLMPLHLSPGSRLGLSS